MQEDLLRTLVIDLGTARCKFGFCDDASPSSFPTRLTMTAHGDERKVVSVGQEKGSPYNKSTQQQQEVVVTPIEKGIITDWDAVHGVCAVSSNNLLETCSQTHTPHGHDNNTTQQHNTLRSEERQRAQRGEGRGETREERERGREGKGRGGERGIRGRWGRRKKRKKENLLLVLTSPYHCR